MTAPGTTRTAPRLLAALAVILLVAAAAAGRARADWHSEQPLVAGVHAELGEVGDVEFWAPNHGMLITAGSGSIGAGLFAYDGTGWYRYSTVCGGHEGRIAWAGPDDFWTISDQPPGQEGFSPAAGFHVSLCHFVNGQVVASYAQPLGVAKSYLPMDAAACNGPSNCWFAGEPLPGSPNAGAFHLHWNGIALAAVPSLTEPQPEVLDPGRRVTGLAFFGGGLFESVKVSPGDEAPGEPSGQPYFFHRIFEGNGNPFVPLPTEKAIEYGSGAEPSELQGFRLSADAEGLWAAAGSEGSENAKVTVLRLGARTFEQVGLSEPQASAAFGVGASLSGLAAEPGTGGAWLAYGQRTDTELARVVWVGADGTVGEPVQLPGEAEGISPKGLAGPIACAAAEQCWLATERGWLFHLGANPAPDPDPYLHALVEFRPPDESLPSLPPAELPEDDSGARSPFERAEEPALEERGIEAEATPRAALVRNIKQKVVDHTLLLMTFLLSRPAHVQLVAELHRKPVAQTKRYAFEPGPHKLKLRLDPQKWPTKLNLKAHPMGPTK